MKLHIAIPCYVYGNIYKIALNVLLGNVENRTLELHIFTLGIKESS